ncbi:MAG: PrsW family glutamic-type intramembrane protease [Pyrinomonadaceae bacterium]
MRLRLTLGNDAKGTRTFDLETGFLTIGRGDNCIVRFDPARDRVVSKQHAFIEARQDGFYLTDNRSTNGTFVNGRRVQTIKLNDGDRLQFGRGGPLAIVSIDGGGPRADIRQAEIAAFREALGDRPVTVQASLAQIGVGGGAVAKESNTGRYVGIGAAVLLAIPMLLIVVAIMFLSLGVVPAVVATAIAFTPAALYILPLMAIDRYDPEPFWLLAAAFAWGALVAVIVSLVVNTLFGAVVYGGTGSAGLASVASAVVSAPIIEEASKGLGVVILLVFFRRYFDDILDGIVFGGVIALGFATVENVMYYGEGLNRAIAEFGWTSSALWSFLFLFTLRGILSPFAHVTFTSMTGIGCGISRESHNGFVRLSAPVVGYVLAVVLHGIWNGMGIALTILLVTLGFEPSCAAIGLGGEDVSLCGFFTGYLLLEIPLFLAFVGFVFYVTRRQRRILNDMLAIEVVRGLIPEDHIRIATSASRSLIWLVSGLTAGRYRARSRYLRAIGKLGLSYWHIQRATAAQGKTGSFQQNPILREEVLRLREQI